jgi:hypothetical protein
MAQMGEKRKGGGFEEGQCSLTQIWIVHLDCYRVLLAPWVLVVDGYDEDLMLQGHAHALGQ